MKKILGVLILCLAVALGVTACGGSSDDGSGGDSADLIMIAAPPGDDFYYTIEQAAKREAEKAGANLEVQRFSKWEAAAQTSVLNAAIVKNPDAILIGPVDTEALQAPLEQAANRGIKIITYDTTTAEPEGVVSTFISGDITELGESAGNAVVDLIGAKGKVMYAGTQPDQSFFNSLREGWTNVMDAQPEIEQLPVTYSDWEPSKANSQMETTLTAHPDLAGGFAGIYVDQEGEVPALERADKLGQVKLVGVDGAPSNVQRLRDGALAAIVSVKAADYGTEAVQAALKAIAGEELPADTVIGQCVLTADNLEDPKNAGCLYEKAQK